MVQFRAGSYKIDNGFARSIERRSGSEGNWSGGMILINTVKRYDKAEEAALHAKMDIDSSHSKAVASKGEFSIDHVLVKLGYDRLEKE